MKPSHAIFRVSNDMFAEVPIDKNGVIGDTADIFSVLPDDTYNELKSSQIVLAHKPTRDTSNVLLSFTLFEKDNVTETNIGDVKHDELVKIIKYIYDTEFVEH